MRIIASPTRSRCGVREAGSATLEYVGALALVAVLVLALTLPMVSVGTALRTKLCQVAAAVSRIGGGPGGGTCGGSPSEPQAPADPPFDPKPVKCKVGDHKVKYGAEVTIAVIKIGQSATLLETRYSNGTVSYTATNGGQLGLVVSAPGAEARLGGAEAGAKVDLGGDFKVDAGSTWNFANQADADAMRKQLDAYRHDQTAQAVSPAWRLVDLIKGATKPPRLPDQTVATIEVGVYGEAKAGVTLPGQKSGPTVPSPPIPGLGGASAPTPPEAGFKLSDSAKWTVITDTTKQTKTYTTAGEGYGQANLTVGPVKGEYKHLLGSSIAFTRDKNNQLTNLTLVTTTENKGTVSLQGGKDTAGGKGALTAGGSGVHVTTTSLDLHDDQQRALAESWLHRQTTDPLAGVSDQTAFPDTLVPGDAFQNLMFTGATVSDVHYANVTDKLGFALKVKDGVSVGIDLSREEDTSKATSATYLGAPGDGAVSRPPVSFPDCTG